jgi:purine-binding chemotaxis protein CheW
MKILLTLTGTVPINELPAEKDHKIMTAITDSETLLADTDLASLAGKYLTFTLERESFAIPVIKVREIIRLIPVTAMPQMPAYVRGVINLRGKIVPVIDLRIHFGFATAVSTDQTCIVVVQVRNQNGGTTAMGLIVDGVEEVVQIAATDLEATPDFGTQVSTDYLLAMAKLKGTVKGLLDIDRVVCGSNPPLS